MEEPTSDPGCPRCADLKAYRATLEAAPASIEEEGVTEHPLAAMTQLDEDPLAALGLYDDPVPVPLAGLEGAEDWEVGPCVDRLGHVTSWDINIKPEPGARGVAVIASVYSGEKVARAILAAIKLNITALDRAMSAARLGEE